MTLTIHTEEDNQRQLLLTIEVDEARVENAMRAAASKLSRDIVIPGFRRGKAPYSVVLRRIGYDALRAEAVEEMINPIFEEALQDMGDLQIFSQPSLTKVEVKPTVLHFAVPLVPRVDLGDYRSLRQEIKPVQVTAEAVNAALKQLQLKHQTLEDVDRAAEMGDMLTVSGIGKLVAVPPTESEETVAETPDDTPADETAVTPDESIIFAEEHLPLPLVADETFPGTNFVDYLAGLQTGDEARFNITFPADYVDAELAGKTAAFTINILNVQSRYLPPFNDELALLEGEETLDALQEKVHHDLYHSAADSAQTEVIDQMVETILPLATIVYPPAAVEEELDNMIQTIKNEAQRAGWEWDDYVRLQNRSEAAIREMYRFPAEERLKRSLIVRQFLQNEKITLQPEDIAAAIDKQISGYSDQTMRDGIRSYYEQGNGLETVTRVILHDKLYERISAIFSGTAPDLSPVDGETAVDEEE